MVFISHQFGIFFFFVSWESRTSQSCVQDNLKDEMQGWQVQRSGACQEREKPSLA